MLAKMSRIQKWALLPVPAAAIVLALTTPEQPPELREVVPACVRVERGARYDLMQVLAVPVTAVLYEEE